MSGGGGQTSTTTQNLSPEQKQILGLVTPVLANYIGPNGQVNASAFPGSTVAPTNPLQTLGGQITAGTAMGPVAQSAGTALGGTDFLTSGAVLDPSQNPGLQGAINAAIRPLNQNYLTSILPGIRDSAVTAGGYGSNRQGIAEGLAAQGLEQQTGDVTSNIINQAYQQGLDAMTKGLAVAPGIQQAALAPGVAVSGVGSQQQQLEQQQLSGNVNQYYTQQMLPLMIAQQIAGTAFGFPGGSATTTQSGSNTSPLQMGLGGASAIMGLLPFLMGG